MSDSNSMVVWPPQLPLPMVDSSGTPQHATEAGSTVNARIQRRNRFKSAGVSLSVKWTFTETEYRYFKAFFWLDLDIGAAVFLLELKYPNTGSLIEWQVHFLGGYSASYLEGLWLVEAMIELRKAPALLTVSPLVGWTPFYVYDTESGGYIPFEDSNDLLYCVKT